MIDFVTSDIRLLGTNYCLVSNARSCCRFSLRTIQRQISKSSLMMAYD